MAGLRKRRPGWNAEGLPSQQDFHDILDDIDRQLRDLDGRMVAGDTAHTVNAAAIATVTRTVSSGGGGGGVTIHNSLHGLQGGLAPSEYYHFSELLHHELAATVGASGFSAYQTTLYGDYTEGHVIYAGAGGALSGDAGLIWLPTPNYLGIFGSGSTNSSPMTHIHVEASADDVSGNRTMAYFKNVNDGVAGFAQVVVEANLGGAWAALCQFGTNYTGIAQWAGKSVVYGSIGTTGLALAALSGAVEFWLYEQGYPVSNYTHVADITNAAGDIGLLPFADSSYILGSETGPKRWKDGSFDQIHTDALLEVTGAHGIDVDGWHIKDGGAGVITGGTNTFNITNGTAVLDVAAGATLDVNANLTVEAASAINQDLTSDSTTAVLAGLLLSADLIASDLDFQIKLNTADGSDTGRVVLAGGGAATIGATRGASVIATGNEFTSANYQGTLILIAGASGTTGTYDSMMMLCANGALGWFIDRSRNFMPLGAGTLNIGDASNYIGDLSYKTLTDRGCLGDFSAGVEMPDGSILSDMAALQAIKVDPTKETIYGVPRLDYASMPKAVYKPALIATKDVYEPVEMPEEGKEPEMVLRWRKGDKMGEDGAELTALISIMLGATKTLDERLIKIEMKLT
jgi:hypothetical protein